MCCSPGNGHAARASALGRFASSGHGAGWRNGVSELPAEAGAVAIEAIPTMMTPHHLRSVIRLLNLAVLGASTLVGAAWAETAGTNRPGPDSSLTILPVRLAGSPMVRISEVVGLMLERNGLKRIEIGTQPFAPPKQAAIEAWSDSLGHFLKEHPVATDFVLYAEFNGTRETGLQGVSALLGDAHGTIIWTCQLTKADEAFAKLKNPEPMTLALLLAEQVGPKFGLSAETAKAAKPGKLARLMEERSGLPTVEEREAIKPRQSRFAEALSQATLVVFPVRIGTEFDVESAAAIAQELSHLGIGKAVSVGPRVALSTPQRGPNELKILWDLAREFRDFLRKQPPGADYAVFADYAFNPRRWEQGFVHLIVCDARGDWVIVDLQNSHQADYESVKPTSKADCDQLATRRLRSYATQAPENLSGGAAVRVR